MVLANQNAKLTGQDQGFLVSPLVLTLKPWERGCPKIDKLNPKIESLNPKIESLDLKTESLNPKLNY